MAEKKTEKKLVASAHTYDVLRRPIISEKAAKLSESNGVVFEVAMSATKEDIAKAVEVLFGKKQRLRQRQQADSIYAFIPFG